MVPTESLCSQAAEVRRQHSWRITKPRFGSQAGECVPLSEFGALLHSGADGWAGCLHLLGHGQELREGLGGRCTHRKAFKNFLCILFFFNSKDDLILLGFLYFNFSLSSHFRLGKSCGKCTENSMCSFAMFPQPQCAQHSEEIGRGDSITY